MLSAFLTTSMHDVALAGKKTKARFSALVAGRRLKVKRAIIGTYVTTGFGVGGQAPPKRRISRSLSFNCLGDLKATPLPAVISGCLGAYTEKDVRRGGGLKQWTSSDIDVTVQSFDGTKLVGTFRGVIQPSTSNPTEPTVTVEAGTFQVFLRSFGI